MRCAPRRQIPRISCYTKLWKAFSKIWYPFERLEQSIPNNRPFHGLWRHLGWGANTPKITVNVRDFGPLGPSFTPLQRGRFPHQRFILKDICTEIIFVKYKEEIQVITTANEFLRFHTNPSYQHHANYREIRSHMGRFIIRIYAGAPNEYNICSEKQKLPRIFYTLKKARNF